MKRKISLCIIGILFLAFMGGDAFAYTLQWVPESGDYLTTVGGYSILEYKNARTGGYDWTVTGSGADGGNGSSQLWLFDPPNTASVTFSVASHAISFMMAGDYNDGYAKFVVDGIDVGTFDLYNLGNQSLLVLGLPYGIHTIEVVQVGAKNPNSSDDHVAIYGGAAIVPEPSSLLLCFLVGLLLYSMRKKMNRTEKFIP